MDAVPGRLSLPVTELRLVSLYLPLYRAALDGQSDDSGRVRMHQAV